MEHKAILNSFPVVLLLAIPGSAYASSTNNLYHDFSHEISKPNISAKYLSKEKKIVFSGGTPDKSLSDYMAHDIVKSIKDAKGNIKEDCPKEGAFDLDYEFHHVTEHFISFARVTSYLNCYATGQPDIEYRNIYDHDGTVVKVQFNVATAPSLKYDWNTVDEECKDIPDDATGYALLVSKSGTIEVDINKSPICDLNLKLQNENKYLLFKKIPDQK